MSEHGETLVQPAAPGSPSAPRVVVGVDGTAANWSAVSWAVAEARRTGSPLLLVAAASGDTPAPHTDDLEAEHLDRLTSGLLDDVRARIAGQALDISTQVTLGDPIPALVGAADRDDLLVVGKRGGYPWSRAVLGSTSVAVAGRCRGPVVVVPEGWSVAEHQSDPVVAGIDGNRDSQVLAFAFDRAHTLAVTLVAVHAWAVSAPYTCSAADVRRWVTDAQAELGDILAPWQRQYSHLGVRAESHPLSPTVSLLGVATTAQLLVVGRRTGPQHPGGLGLGSTARPVLHHAPCPVVVVPSPPGPASTTPERHGSR